MLLEIASSDSLTGRYFVAFRLQSRIYFGLIINSFERHVAFREGPLQYRDVGVGSDWNDA